MSIRRGILELATSVALLTACGSEYQPYTVAPTPPTPPLEALLVRAGPNSTGTGTVAGSGIDCSISGVTSTNTCAASLSQGKVVTLTADATGGSTFIEWGDACAASGSNLTCTVTVSQALNVAASFAAPPPPPTFLVTVRAGSASTGSGAVSGAGITCTISGTSQSGDCGEELVQGTQLTLTATATGGSNFAGWGGACSQTGTAATCTITVSQATTIEASFALPPPPPPKYVVTLVAGSGSTGTGTVTGVGINCTISGTSQSGDCSEELVQGTELTLAATASGGGSFLGWGGACVSAGANPSCTITVTQAAMVEASFATPPAPPPPPPPKYVVTLVPGSGSTGTGTVTGVGINCTISGTSQSGDCGEELVQGTQLTLTATATGGSNFAGWGGACSQTGTAATCTITVSQATTIEASFTAPPPPPPPKYVVTLVAGSGSTGTGSVTGVGINCTISGTSQSGDCSEELVQGTQLTLTATATGGSNFAGWGGACSQTGTAATCAITVSQATTIEASFTAPPPPSVAGFWSGTDAGTNIHYHITLAQSGSTLTLWPNCAPGDCRLIALSSTGADWLGASYADIASLTGTVSTSAITFTMNLGNQTIKFEGALTSPTRMIGQVSSATMPPQSLTLDKQ